MHICLVLPDHPLRGSVERLSRSAYARAYGADIDHLPERIIAVLDAARLPICAAGLRDADTGFFSEIYLTDPVERRLADATGEAVGRDEIVEATALAAVRPGHLMTLLHALARVSLDGGYRWGLFTVTRQLRLAARRLDVPLVELGPADAQRIPHPERWGSYYEHDPRVCAVDARLAMDRLTAVQLRCAARPQAVAAQ